MTKNVTRYETHKVKKLLIYCFTKNQDFLLLLTSQLFF